MSSKPGHSLFGKGLYVARRVAFCLIILLMAILILIGLYAAGIYVARLVTRWSGLTPLLLGIDTGSPLAVGAGLATSLVFFVGLGLADRRWLQLRVRLARLLRVGSSARNGGQAGKERRMDRSTFSESSPKVLTPPKALRIFVYVSTVGMCAGMVATIVHALVGDIPNMIARVLIIAPALVVICFFGLAAVTTARARLTLDEDHIELAEFGTRRLRKAEVLGFRVRGQNVIICPRQSGKKAIKISAHYHPIEEVKAWLGDRFVDLDRRHAEKGG